MAKKDVWDSPRTLSRLGPHNFFQFAYHTAGINPSSCYPIRTPSPARGMTLHPADFISLVHKFTSAYHHDAKIEGVITLSPERPDHLVTLRGVRDPGIRSHGDPRFLEEYQQGIWSCLLKDMLVFGIIHEQIQELRATLCLRQDDGVDDTTFFQIRIVIPF